jgi:hypothetical protein
MRVSGIMGIGIWHGVSKGVEGGHRWATHETAMRTFQGVHALPTGHRQVEQGMPR